MRRPIRLVTIGHSYAVSLNRRLAHEMALQGAGQWEVVAVAPRYFHGHRDLRPVTTQVELQERVRPQILPAHLTRQVHFFFYGSGLSELLKQADFVHCWEEPFIVAGAQVAWLTPASTPLVFATFQNLGKHYPPPFAQMEQFSMRRAAGWIAFATSVVDALGNRDVYRHRPMRQIAPGVDLDAFFPDPTARAQTRRTLGWGPEGPPVVGYLGRFNPEKGIEDLMASLDMVSSPWRALFVGAGPLEGSLKIWASKHPDRVRVCTDVSHAQVPAYLNAMDVLAAPSRTTEKWREQFGRMLIEGFACGLPVVGSNSGEIPHVIADAGVVVPEKNVAAWADELGKLIDDPERRKNLGLLGLDRAREQFSWAVVARRHLEFFSELLSSNTSNAFKTPGV